MMQSLPLLVMAIIMAAALGPSLHNTILAIAIPLVPYVARVIRANTLSLREQPFVEAAKAIGMSEMRIAIRHVLPNTLAPLIVLATAQLGSTILTEASLSFLGLGVPEPHPSWGRMLSESAAEYVRTAPWLVIFPGLAISFVVFGTNLLGDALARPARPAAAQLSGRRSIRAPDQQSCGGLDCADEQPTTTAYTTGRGLCGHDDRRQCRDGRRGRGAADLPVHPPRRRQGGRRRIVFGAAAAKRWRSSANPAAARR